MMEKWNNLPKAIKVFFYLALSTILAEGIIELRQLDQTFIIRVLAQMINMGIVLLEEYVPAVRARIKK